MFVSSMVESALQTFSNSLFAFIFCNLIILLILLGSKFSSTDSETRDALSGLRRYINAKPAEMVDEDGVKHAGEKLALVQVSEVCVSNSEMNGKEEHEDEDGEYDYEAENEDNGEEANGDDDDDELRRRIEDFIRKVNREWNEENLKDRKPKLTLLDQPMAWITQKA